MRSLSLGKVFGIEIVLHWTFVLLALLLVATLLVFNPQNGLSSILIFLFLFLSVLVHELSHSVVALQLKSRVQRIVLLPIGGVSIADELPENPKEEFMIAVAGPLFNFILVFAILILVTVFPLSFPRDIFAQGLNFDSIQLAIVQYPLFALFWLNLVLGSFNLFLPALPLDGGRVFRSLFGMKLGYAQATHFISKISTILAVLLFLYGLFFGGILVMAVAVFIFFGAQQEERIALVRESAKDLSLLNIVNKHPLVLAGNQTVREALGKMIELNQNKCLVELHEGFGLLDLSGLAKKEFSEMTLLENLVLPVPIILETDSAAKVLEKFLTKGYALLPVVNSECQLIGIIEGSALEREYQLSKIKKLFKL